MKRNLYHTFFNTVRFIKSSKNTFQFKTSESRRYGNYNQNANKHGMYHIEYTQFTTSSRRYVNVISKCKHVMECIVSTTILKLSKTVKQ